MGLLDPTTHLQKTTRTSLLGTRIVVAWCGKEFPAGDVEPGSEKPGWVASCGKCQRKAG